MRSVAERAVETAVQRAVEIAVQRTVERTQTYFIFVSFPKSCPL